MAVYRSIKPLKISMVDTLLLSVAIKLVAIYANYLEPYMQCKSKLKTP